MFRQNPNVPIQYLIVPPFIMSLPLLTYSVYICALFLRHNPMLILFRDLVA